MFFSRKTLLRIYFIQQTPKIQKYVIKCLYLWASQDEINKLLSSKLNLKISSDNASVQNYFSFWILIYVNHKTITRVNDLCVRLCFVSFSVKTLWKLQTAITDILSISMYDIFTHKRMFELMTLIYTIILNIYFLFKF